MDKRYAGDDVLMTKLIKLRSRMMRNYQVRFWRAVEGATSSLTLIILVAGGHSETSIINGCGAVQKTTPVVAVCEEASTILKSTQLSFF